MTFFGLLGYIWLQTLLSQKLPVYSTKRIYIFRLIFCSICTVNLFLSMFISISYQFYLTRSLFKLSYIIFVKAGIFSLIATSKFNGKDKLKWGKDDGVREKKNHMFMNVINYHCFITLRDMLSMLFLQQTSGQWHLLSLQFY